MVPMFITAAPAGSPWTTPLSPKSTSWTASALVTIRMVAWVPEAASAGESARRAPASITGPAFSGLLFHTASSWPTSSKFLAIGVPIAPNPMNPSFIFFLASSGYGWCYPQQLILHSGFSLHGSSAAVRRQDEEPRAVSRRGGKTVLYFQLLGQPLPGVLSHVLGQGFD